MKPNSWLGGLIAAGLLVLAIWLWWACRYDTKVAFLPGDRRAEWIVYPKPPDTIPHRSLSFTAVFRRTFQCSTISPDARLFIRVFRQGQILLNGQPVTELILDEHDWKSEHTCPISRYLRAGTNELVVTVANAVGPPAFWLVLESNGSIVRSDPAWEVSLAGAAWQNAALATDAPAIRPGGFLFGRERVAESLKRVWPALLMIVVLSLACAVALPWLLAKARRWSPKLAQVASSPFGLLLVIMVLWVILFCNNLPRLPSLLGFDRDGHLQYIDYLLQKKALPLADEGWTMYQPPLFYLVSALAIGPFGVMASADGAVLALRVMACLTGLAQLLIIYFCLRLYFRGKPNLQMVGLVFAGFLPANLILSHHVTNEVLSALFVTAGLYFILRLLACSSEENETGSPSRARLSPLGLQVAAGLCLGLALLTKFSALLAVPILLVAAAWPSLIPADGGGRGRFSPVGAFRTVGVISAAILVICGWHYLRVWRHFGNPLIGNWDPRLPFAWWQDPGYHTASWYWRFGQALVTPLFSSLSGLADGLYTSLWGDGLVSGGARMGFRPPWNYDVMNLGFLLSLVPSALLILGGVSALVRFLRQPGPREFVVLALPAAFAAGILLMTLRVPSYAQVKAFYALPALLPGCILAAQGWEAVSRRGARLRWALCAALCAWALSMYASLWIRNGNPFTHIAQGVGLADDKRFAEASAQFQHALDLDPRSLAARVNWIDTLTLSGLTNEAAAQAALALDQHPEAAEALMQMGLVIARAGRLEEGVGLLRRSVQQAPDNPNIYGPLAVCLARLGRPVEAIAACEEGLRVNPVNPELRQRLALTLVGAGDFTNAVAHLQLVLQIKPGWPEAQSLLAFALYSSGRLSEAALAFEQALRLAPQDPKLNYLNALTLASLGRTSEAVRFYRATLKLQPETIEALNNLAWVLAASPDARLRDGPEAVKLAEHACNLTERREPILLGTLAAAYAESGRFPDAVATAEAAQKLAVDGGQREIAAKNLELLELYRTGKPFRDPTIAEH